MNIKKAAAIWSGADIKCLLYGNENIFQNMAQCARFFREFAHSPRQVGSICPSGRALAASMAREALNHDCADDSLIIDLGTGTGIVSSRLLKEGVSHGRIVAVDVSRNFMPIFRKNCGSIPLYINDACELNEVILRDYPSVPVRAIISSLPLRSLPCEKVADILEAVRECLLERGGVLIQFTYALWQRNALARYGFARYASRIVYNNLPPALVEAYKPVQ